MRFTHLACAIFLKRRLFICLEYVCVIMSGISLSVIMSRANKQKKNTLVLFYKNVAVFFLLMSLLLPLSNTGREREGREEENLRYR